MGYYLVLGTVSKEAMNWNIKASKCLPATSNCLLAHTCIASLSTPKTGRRTTAHPRQHGMASNTIKCTLQRTATRKKRTNSPTPTTPTAPKEVTTTTEETPL